MICQLNKISPSLPALVSWVLEHLEGAGFEVYIVGGAVRDLLLGGSPTDFDLATNTPTSDRIALLSPPGPAFLPPWSLETFGATYGVVKLTSVLEGGGRLSVELAQFRKEGAYLDHRHPSVIEPVETLAEDLVRRDFTINALALNRAGEVWGDPLSYEDLNQRIIRTIGDPDRRFQEDALRLMRAVRFATCLGFSLEKKTREGLLSWAPLLGSLDPKVLRPEWDKILASPHWLSGFVLLHETGLLSYLLPFLERDLPWSELAVGQESSALEIKLPESEYAATPKNSVFKKNDSDPIARLAWLFSRAGWQAGDIEVETTLTQLSYGKKKKKQVITRLAPIS